MICTINKFMFSSQNTRDRYDDQESIVKDG